VGVFPNPEVLLRLAGAVLIEAHDEWQVSDRRYLSEGSMALLTKATKEVTPAQLMPAWTLDTDPHGDSTYTTPRDVTRTASWTTTTRPCGQSAARSRSRTT
jgi:hypothetical protein